MGFRDFKVSNQAIEDGVRLGIRDDVRAKIAHMARFSAIITYPGANRRYQEYALRIEDGVVLRVLRFDLAKNIQALEEAEAKKRQARRKRGQDKASKGVGR